MQRTVTDDAERVQVAYLRTFGRPANAAEVRRALDFLRESAAELASSENEGGRLLCDGWQAFCQALLASNELRYID